MNFILSVKNREAKDFDYSLTKTSMVIQRLQEYEFEQKEIYNFDLMEELLKNDDEQTKREILIKQLSDESEISWRFIDEFIDKTKYQEKFILLLSSKWCGLWQYISSLSILQYDRQLYYLSLLINILNVNDIEKLNINNSIKDYIENHSDIIQKLSILTSNEALCSVLAELKVSLGIHEFEGVQEYILDFIFDNNLYKLNEKMIFNVVLYKNSTMVDTLNTKPYTTIIDLGYNKIIDYINLNFEYYMEYNILVKHTLEDRQDIIIDMLLKILSNQNFCVALIKLEQFKVHDIKQFLEKEIENHKEDIKIIWNTLLSNEKIEPIWENIMSYWEYFSFNETLIEYIIEHIEELKKENTSCCTDEFIQDFILANFENYIYEKLLPILRMKEFNFDIEKLTENMLSLMINIKYFDFTVTKCNYFENEYPNLTINYIVKNQEEFLDKVKEINMSNKLLNELLTNDLIDSTIKNKVFDLFAENYMSQDIVLYIVSSGIEIKKSCFEVAWKYANLNQKERMFIDNLELLDCNDLEKYFQALGEKYTRFIDRTSRHTVKLLGSEDHLKLAKYLEKIEYITSYEVVNKYKNSQKSDINKENKIIKYRIKQKK